MTSKVGPGSCGRHSAARSTGGATTTHLGVRECLLELRRPLPARFEALEEDGILHSVVTAPALTPGRPQGFVLVLEGSALVRHVRVCPRKVLLLPQGLLVLYRGLRQLLVEAGDLLGMCSLRGRGAGVVYRASHRPFEMQAQLPRTSRGVSALPHRLLCKCFPTFDAWRACCACCSCV